SHRHEACAGTTRLASGSKAELGPHRVERRRTTCLLRFFAHDSPAFPATDADSAAFTGYRADAASHRDPPCADAPTAAESETKSCKAGAKAGGAGTREVESKADARFSLRQSCATQNKDSRSKTCGTQSRVRAGENRYADKSAEAAERRGESRPDAYRQRRCSYS